METRTLLSSGFALLPGASRRPTLLGGALLALALAQAASAQGAPPSDDAVRYGSPPSLPAGTTQEQMWPAATEEGWKKPCLIPWQRSFDDALAVARATGKPILVAVNMDGEIASEHFAGVRYRDPETAALLEPYVCLVASVYRHTPRDHDEHGRRILCPRFGSVTCGEHIAIESELYEKYFDGARVAPRHIAIELDGSELYDVYFSWDTQTVFTALVKGVENRPPPRPLQHDDLPLVERVASPALQDRQAIEQAYVEGTPQQRRALLEQALKVREVDQVELLRLAIFGLDLELAKLARRALARSDSESAIDLIAEALKVPLEPDEREMLLGAAERLAARFPRARTLVAVHQGDAQRSELIDAQRLAQSAGSYYAPGGASAGEASVERSAERVERSPGDPEAQLALAESFVERAAQPSTTRRFAELLLEDARRAARDAAELGAEGWELEAVRAVIADQLGQHDEALKHAVGAVEGGMWSPERADASIDRIGLRVLMLFAQARQGAIARAYRERSEWPPQWLADVNAAYTVIARHPLAGDAELVSYYDFLRWLGATPRAGAVLEDALARFPDSPLLHERLRARALWESGAEGLEAAYARRLQAGEPSAALLRFAGYASLVAAEQLRRGGHGDEALVAYERGIAHYERSEQLAPGASLEPAHFVALAHAGRARIALERGELELATAEILAAFHSRPEAAATLDGLGITPVETAKMLLSRLDEPAHEELAARLREGLAALDPRLLEPRADDRLPGDRAPGPRRGRGPRAGGR